MARTIIENYSSFGFEGSNGSATLTLRVNSELKKLGFKKMFMGSEYVDKDDIEKGLTIHFLPYFRSNTNYQTRDALRGSFVDLRSHLLSLSGAEDWYEYYSLRNTSFEKQVTLKIEFNGGNYEIGHYIPLRNIVVIYLPIKHNWNTGLKNKYVLEVLKYIKEVVGKYEIKEIDTSKVREEIMLNKFALSTNKKIDNFNNTITSSEQYIEEFESKLVNWYREIKQGREAIEGLQIFITQIKKGLMAKMEEIKAFKFVKDIRLADEGIEIKFEELFIKFNKKDIRMGNYTITLFPEKIRIVNDSPIEWGGSYYHHLHIRDETVCFGESKSLAYRLLGELDLKKLTHFLWLYLNSFNVNDTYIPMRDWVAGRDNNNVVPDREEEARDDEEGRYN